MFYICSTYLRGSPVEPVDFSSISCAINKKSLQRLLRVVIRTPEGRHYPLRSRCLGNTAIPVSNFALQGAGSIESIISKVYLNTSNTRQHGLEGTRHTHMDRKASLSHPPTLLISLFVPDSASCRQSFSRQRTLQSRRSYPMLYGCYCSSLRIVVMTSFYCYWSA